VKATRKNYLELWLGDQPAIASGRSSNRHTTLVEALEHAEEHAIEIGQPGTYEIRIDGGLYYTVNIRNVVLDHTVEPEEPPAAQAQFYFEDLEYSGNENTVIQFQINRNIRIDQVCDVDWAITNASVTPTSGTERFQIGDVSKVINVTAQEVLTSEFGSAIIDNPVLISGPAGNPIIVAPNVVDFFVINTDTEELPQPDPQQDTYFSGTDDEVADIDWRLTEDLCTGFDWSFPYTHVKKFAGAFQNPAGEGWPNYWRAGRLRRVNLEWDEMETSKGNYSGCDDAIDQLDQVLADGYDGAHVNVRGVVAQAWKDGVPQTLQVTCPAWLYAELGNGNTELTTHGSGWDYRNVKLDNAYFQTRWRLLIDQLENRGFFTHPAIHNQLFHAASNSQGEEATSGQWEDPAVQQSWFDGVIDYWMDKWVAAGNAHKAMWLNADEPLYSGTVDRGAGNRAGGSIESWVINKYHPGDPAEHGMVAEVYVPGSNDNANGEFYLRQDKDFVFPKENRAWQEQNERGYNVSSRPQDRFHYRMAHLRCAQLRFDNVFTDEDPSIDFRIDHWLSMQMGQQPEDQSCEAVCYLGEFYGRGGDQISPFTYYKQKNMEHNLYQREYHGATTAVDQRDYNKGIGNAQFDASIYTHGWFARRFTNAGFAVDGDFITGAQAIALKITFKDSGSHPITVSYNAGGGIGSGTRTHTTDNSGDVRTLTWFLYDFRANATGLNPDFYIQTDGNVNIYMARIIKL